MSDIYNRSLPFSQDRYRQETEKRASMLGAGSTPKKTKCCRCLTHRTVATGTQTDGRFVCHQCLKSEKSAAKSADAKTAASSVR